MSAVTTRARETATADTTVAQRMPGPWPARASAWFGDPHRANQACEGCHVEIAEQWRTSLHARAYTNPAFQRALAIEPLPFCRGCHAPESNPMSEGDARLQALGVGCVTCHIVSADVLSSPEGGPIGAHALTRSAEFSGPEACANCHEFAFPGETAASGFPLMQSTMTEHRSSEFAHVACAKCHMPLDPQGHRSHRFDVTRNERLLRNALQVQVRRLGSGKIEFDLTAKGVGHSFPTGDLFRRIRVHVEAIGPEFSAVDAADAYLTRTFVTLRSAGGFVRRVNRSDTRLGTGRSRTRRVTLELVPDSEKFPIAYWITYERVEHPGQIGQPDAVIEGQVELASGRLESIAP